MILPYHTLAIELFCWAVVARIPPAVGYIDAISLRELATAIVPTNDIMLFVIAMVSSLSRAMKAVRDKLIIEQTWSSTIGKRSCYHTGYCLPGRHETKAE